MYLLIYEYRLICFIYVVMDEIDSYSVRQETSTDGEPHVLRLAVKSADKKGLQLWYEDRDSVLHSQFDDLVIDVSTS